MITMDDNVAFYWFMLTDEVEEKEMTRVLLEDTVRGFSFSTSLMMYKHVNKKKVKSLRRKLCTD